MHFLAWIYIMTNSTNSVLYTGFTTDLKTRRWEHSSKQNPSAFTARYSTKKLVYFEGFLSINEARAAEKYIKGKTRAWKKALISRNNPGWVDLSSKLKLL
jgi:putative endonuclease